jgi:hypothetical protein
LVRRGDHGALARANRAQNIPQFATPYRELVTTGPLA